MSRSVHGTGRARQRRHEHASTQEMRARARYGLCVQVLPRAGRTSTLCRASTRTACYSTSDASEDTELPQTGVSQHHSLPRTTADLATRPARQAPIRCPGARTRLRALYREGPPGWAEHPLRTSGFEIKYGTGPTRLPLLSFVCMGFSF